MIIDLIIQARMTSTRLPGKVLLPIAGKPMLWHVIYRVSLLKNINNIIVATSTDRSDDMIAKFCSINNIKCFRGSLDNVLSRYYEAALQEKADIIIRITADCPLIDAKLIERGLKIFKDKKLDYLSNVIERTYPVGFDFEIFTSSLLEKAYRNAKIEAEKEHVTPYFYLTHPDKFKIYNLKQNKNKSSYRLTVDTAQDLALIKILIEKYQAQKKDFQKIITILENHPELVSINKNVKAKVLTNVIV